MQYYNVLGEADVPTDVIDRALDCISLQRVRTGGYGSKTEYSGECGLCPSDSVRRLVHVVREDIMTRLLHPFTTRSRSIAVT